MLKFDVHLASSRPWMIHLIGASVVTAVGASFYFGHFLPSARDQADRRERMAQLHALMANKEQIGEEHSQLKARLAELQKRSATIRKRMPSRSPAQDFIERATQLAGLCDLDMEMCTASAPQAASTHSQVEVTCRLRGRYASICRYLAAIDQTAQVSRISRLEVSSGNDSDAYPAQVVFQLYYRSELHDTEVKRGTL